MPMLIFHLFFHAILTVILAAIALGIAFIIAVAVYGGIVVLLALWEFRDRRDRLGLKQESDVHS